MEFIPPPLDVQTGDYLYAFNRARFLSQRLFFLLRTLGRLDEKVTFLNSLPPSALVETLPPCPRASARVFPTFKKHLRPDPAE